MRNFVFFDELKKNRKKKLGRLQFKIFSGLTLKIPESLVEIRTKIAEP